MNESRPDRNPSLNRRKEKRYRTGDGQRLYCRTSIDDADQDQIWEGTTVDISPSGIRLLTEGDFQVGQHFSTELRTSRSHGVYRGVIRRIEPWVGGQLILGCSLSDLIPKKVLQDLAKEGVINRRSDGRFSISHPARISWPLGPEEIDVELLDYSFGGIKLKSMEPIPESVRLRLRLQTKNEDVVVEATSVWSHRTEEGWFTGVSFVERDAPTIVAETIANESQSQSDSSSSPSTPSTARRVITLAAFVAVTGYALFINL